MILCSQAKLENDNKSINVKRGMRARVEMGLWPGCAPTGYLNLKRTDQKCEVMVDPIRAPIVTQVFQKYAEDGWSGRRIFLWLRNEVKFTTKNGKAFMLSNIYLLLRNPFYTGIFEYPRKSGKWYTGKHEPIITKETFQKVQKRLTQDAVPKGQYKEFAFTKFITCGFCGSGITADEKLKKLNDGTVARYVYYTCTKKHREDCPCGYIREEVLIEEMQKIIDQVSLDELGIKTQAREEFQRYSEFRSDILGVTHDHKQKKLDVESKDYAKYILRKGTIAEKRELLTCIKSRLILKDKKLSLQESPTK
jgi:hypothetical protein